MYKEYDKLLSKYMRPGENGVGLDLTLVRLPDLKAVATHLFHILEVLLLDRYFHFAGSLVLNLKAIFIDQNSLCQQRSLDRRKQSSLL